MSLLVAFLIALGFTFASAPVGVRLARRAGLIDYPGSAPHKHHTRPMPLAGGLVILAAFVIGGTLLRVWKTPMVRTTFVAGLMIFAFGLWDDFRGISPALKLVGQLLGAAILIHGGILVQIFESPDFFVSIPFSYARTLDLIITLIWLLGITNAFNFIDSMDGLAVGASGLIAAFFILLTLEAGQVSLAVFGALLLGICIGVYFFNVRPAQFFLGDSGSQTLGFWLAALAIAYIPQDVSQMSSWFVAVLLFGVPIFDMFLVVFSRLRRGRPVYASARDHTYHRLRAFGLAPNRAVLLMHIAGLVLGVLAMIALNQPPLISNLIFGLVVLSGLLLLLFFEFRTPDRALDS